MDLKKSQKHEAPAASSTMVSMMVWLFLFDNAKMGRDL